LSNLIVAILGNLISSAFSYIFAKLLGGKGSYSKQTAMIAYIFSGTIIISIGTIVLSLPLYVLLPLPIAKIILIAALILINLYGAYSAYKAIKHVHQLSTIRAAAVVPLSIVFGLPGLMYASLLVLGLFAFIFRLSITYTIR
jgi:hypothetical protein